LSAVPAERTVSIRTRFGRVFITWREGTLASIRLSDFSPTPSSPALECGEVPPYGRGLVGDIIRYFRGEPVGFELPDLSGLSDFGRRVLETVWRIPYGGIRTYGEVARAVGVPRGARAVGMALGRNPFPIVIPCHRVVASGGKLGGFGAGVDWKRALLGMEGGEF